MRGSFALTIRAVATVAPSAVTLSATSLSVQSSASLPIALAEAEADGTAPLTWRLTSGAPHVSLDTDGDKPVLRLVDMPAAGTTAISVEASNGAGAASASFALEVRAEIPDAPITVNRGAVGGRH